MQTVIGVQYGSAWAYAETLGVEDVGVLRDAALRAWEWLRVGLVEQDWRSAWYCVRARGCSAWKEDRTPVIAMTWQLEDEA